MHVRVTGLRDANVHMASRTLEWEFRMRVKSHASARFLQRAHPSLLYGVQDFTARII